MTVTPINAVAKVRFSSARAQRVHLADAGDAKTELLCLEGGQQMTLNGPSSLVYVISGTGTVLHDSARTTLATGHLLGIQADVTLTNLNEQRLICLLFHTAS